MCWVSNRCASTSVLPILQVKEPSCPTGEVTESIAPQGLWDLRQRGLSVPQGADAWGEGGRPRIELGEESQ